MRTLPALALVVSLLASVSMSVAQNAADRAERRVLFDQKAPASGVMPKGDQPLVPVVSYVARAIASKGDGFDAQGVALTYSSVPLSVNGEPIDYKWASSLTLRYTRVNIDGLGSRDKYLLAGDHQFNSDNDRFQFTGSLIYSETLSESRYYSAGLTVSDAKTIPWLQLDFTGSYDHAAPRAGGSTSGFVADISAGHGFPNGLKLEADYSFPVPDSEYDYFVRASYPLDSERRFRIRGTYAKDDVLTGELVFRF